MADLKYKPVSRDHKMFLRRAGKCEGFCEAYEESEKEYILIHKMISARLRSGLTQEDVAESMGTTRSAVSRLESAGKHTPSLTTLEKYAKAIGCSLEIKLVPSPCNTKRSTGSAKKKTIH